MNELNVAKSYAKHHGFDIVELYKEKKGRRIFIFYVSKYIGMKTGLPCLGEVLNGRLVRLSPEQVMVLICDDVLPSW